MQIVRPWFLSCSLVGALCNAASAWSQADGAALVLRLEQSLIQQSSAHAPQIATGTLSLRIDSVLASTELGDIRRIPTESELAYAQPVFYAIRVNELNRGEAPLLKLGDGRLVARESDLREWRMDTSAVSSVAYRGERHIPLNAFEGAEQRFDESRQELSLTFPVRYFLPATIEARTVTSAIPEASRLGGFANYDLYYSSSAGTDRLDGQFELGLFGPQGVATAGFVTRDMAHGSRPVRLDTSWRQDFPEAMKTLTLGDAIGVNGIWGRSVRYGGLRYGTNFDTRPGIIRFPMPRISGEATLPTTTELFIDGVLRQQSNVAPGPFSITNLPVITGQGELRMVVRDLLGREQVIVQPYYASNALLREGLVDDSWEFGAVRNAYGMRSDDYGRGVAAYQRRAGISPQFTGEVRGELLHDQQTGGVGGTLALPGFGLVTSGIARSRSSLGDGQLFSVAYERQARQGVSVAFRSQWATPHFTQLGLVPGQSAPARVMSGSIGLALAGYGSLGVSYVRQENRDSTMTSVVSASYSLGFGRIGTLIATAYATLSEPRVQAVSLTFATSFGERGSASVNRSFQRSAPTGSVQVQEGLPMGSGTGYRLMVGHDGMGARREAGYSVQTDVATVIAEASQSGNATAYRVSASGGAGMVDGQGFLARRLSDSFGLALVPGYPNIGVYVNNQIVGRTNAQGLAVMPGLMPYQRNEISVDANELPLDASIESTQKIATPYYRSGLLVRFPIEKSSGALITVKLPDGELLPVGAMVKMVGSDAEFPVAQRGEVYVTGLSDKTRLQATWRGQRCEFEIDYPLGGGPLPRLGPVVCKGVRP